MYCNTLSCITCIITIYCKRKFHVQDMNIVIPARSRRFYSVLEDDTS